MFRAHRTARRQARIRTRTVIARTLRRAAACVALLALALSVGIPADAQDVPGDLSLHEWVNFWERSFAYGLVSGWAHRAHVPALSQPFTTRSNIAGYRLRGVRFNIDFNSDRINYGTQTIGNRTGPTEITVSICDDDNGLPGRDVVEMDLVGRAGDGVMEFRARQVQGADPILLPDTTYHVLFTRGIGGAGYRLGLRAPGGRRIVQRRELRQLEPQLRMALVVERIVGPGVPESWGVWGPGLRRV